MQNPQNGKNPIELEIEALTEASHEAAARWSEAQDALIEVRRLYENESPRQGYPNDWLAGTSVDRAQKACDARHAEYRAAMQKVRALYDAHKEAVLALCPHAGWMYGDDAMPSA